MSRPVAFIWTDEGVMRPVHPRIADKEYAVSERYMLAPYEQRSTASHNHEFAWLHEAWQSLQEPMAERFPTSEHLRKFALIKAGYCDTATTVCSSKAEAIRIAAFIRPMDEFSIVTTDGPMVIRATAKSQSRRAMGNAVFQQSKAAIMDVIADMIGVTTKELSQAEAA